MQYFNFYQCNKCWLLSFHIKDKDIKFTDSCSWKYYFKNNLKLTR